MSEHWNKLTTILPPQRHIVKYRLKTEYDIIEGVGFFKGSSWWDSSSGHPLKITPTEWSWDGPPVHMPIYDEKEIA